MKQNLVLVITISMFSWLLGSSQISLSSVSDFQDGTIQGWVEGEQSPNPPEHVNTGGPDGAGDGYLHNISSGIQEMAGGKWVIFNMGPEWIGDFISAGVERFSMAVRNNGSEPVFMRMSFEGPGGRCVTNQVVEISAESDWENIIISVHPDDLVALAGADIIATMEDVGWTKIINNQNAAFEGAAEAADIDIDNITALGSEQEEITCFKAYLTGRNEVPPRISLGYGEVDGELSGDTLIISGFINGITSGINTAIAGGMHIHLGYAGLNGGVIFPLNADFNEDFSEATLSADNNKFVLNAEQLDQLIGHQLYVNVHSIDFPGGEIRGQLVPCSDAVFATNMMGSFELPSIMTAATGSVVITLQDTNLTVSGSFSGLEGNLAVAVAGGVHIHSAAPLGSNAGILIRLNPTVSNDNRSAVFETSNNTFSLTPAQINDLQARRMYVNAHSTIATGGEIRGQIIDARTRSVFRAHLSGTNEIPFVNSTGQGLLLVEILNDTTIGVSGSFSGLTSDMATNIAGGIHLHGSAPAGSNAGVITPLNAVLNANNRSGSVAFGNNQYTYSQEQIAMLIDRKIYANIHSVGRPGGEIRGQVLHEAPINFTVPMSSVFSVPERFSLGIGTLKGELTGNQLLVSGSFSGLGSPINVNIQGGAHIHGGFAGSTGGILFPLNLTLNEESTGAVVEADSNVFTLSAEQILQLRSRGMYSNVHTIENPSGEIRGQLLFEGATYLVAPLSGVSEVPARNTEANGMAIIEVRGSAASLTGSFRNLSSRVNTNILGGAHIHLGAAGINGGIIVPLNTTLQGDSTSGIFHAANNTLPVSAGLLDTLNSRLFYINVHSLNFPGGEIRGQIAPMAQAYFTANLSGFNSVQPVAQSQGQGAIKLELIGNSLIASGGFTNLNSNFDPSVAGGSHLHQQNAGSNGGIVFGLSVVLSPDNRSGVYLPANNVFQVDDVQKQALADGNFYVNIHTVQNRSGEIRGQILPEINRFPTNDATIGTPEDGSTIIVDDTLQRDVLLVEWEPASDRDLLAYIYQMSMSPQFDTVTFQRNVGANTEIELLSEDLAILLTTTGVPSGDTLTVFHRAVASDGSVWSPGSVSSVHLVNSTVTSINEYGIQNVSIRPVPTSSELTLEFEMNNPKELEIDVIDVNGKLLHKFDVPAFSGKQSFHMDMNALGKGIYFVRIGNQAWPFVKM